MIMFCDSVWYIVCVIHYAEGGGVVCLHAQRNYLVRLFGRNLIKIVDNCRRPVRYFHLYIYSHMYIYSIRRRGKGPTILIE